MRGLGRLGRLVSILIRSLNPQLVFVLIVVVSIAGAFWHASESLPDGAGCSEFVKGVVSRMVVAIVSLGAVWLVGYMITGGLS